MPLLIIDDVEVKAEPGMTILEAAGKVGIWIPTLCYYPKTSPSDSCRMCVVEIDGIERPMTSCNTIVSDGMRVHTDTPRLRTIREEVMNLVLMDHPLDCPVCPAAGECEIQKLTYRLAISGTDLPTEKRNLPIERSWPLIEYNPNLCITCLRCVKVCHEVIGAQALALQEVGYQARIGTRSGEILQCDFCGECVEACPTGAMSNKVFQRWARSWELRKTPTVCPLCSAGCRMELNVKDNRIFRITADPESHNRGTLCVGGRFAFDLVHHKDRLDTPLLRKDGELQPVVWETALAFAATKLRDIVAESGPDAVAGLASPRLTNEDCYAFQKFFRVTIGTNNIDSEARFSFLRVMRALELTAGMRFAGGKLDDLLRTGAILVVGVDPLEETPAPGWKIKAASRRYDSNVVVVNSRATSLDRFARLRLRVRPYSESDVILGIMKVILDLDLWDGKFIRNKTSNFLSMKNLLDKISLKGILKRTGVSGESLEEAARVFGEASNASIIFGGDVILQENGLQCVMNLVNLALLTGNMGRDNAGIYPIFEKGNIIGLCDMGVLPEYLPGYQDTAAVRDRFEGIWNAPLPYGRGKTVPEIVRGLENGEIRALYIAGADPLTDYPHTRRFSAALEKAELVIVQDLFLSPTAAKAHCVFPAASFAEKEGTMTNMEHRVQKLNQAVAPLGAVMPDWSILEEMAKAMGRSMGFFQVGDVFREMSQTMPYFKSLKFQNLPADGVVVGPAEYGHGVSPTGRPYSFAPVRTIARPEPDIDKYPFEMLAGRNMYHFGSTTTRSDHLLSLCSAGYVEINQEDAARLDIAEGEPLEISSAISSFVAPARISSRVSSGMVFVPTNFPNLGVYGLFEENTTVCRVKISHAGRATGHSLAGS